LANADGSRVEPDRVFSSVYETGIGIAWNGRAFAAAWGAKASPDATGESLYLEELLDASSQPMVVAGPLPRPIHTR
jgi:hypothetical protein